MKQLSLFFLGNLILTCLFSFYPTYATPNYVKGNTVFQLYLLNKNWRDYKLNTYQNPGEVLLSEKIIDLKRESLLCITEKDIDLYNWSSQTIFFNQNFTLKLKQTIEKAQQLAEPNAKSKGGGGVFVLVFKGSRVYGGAVNESYNTGYNVPTLFFTYDSDDRISVTIRPLKTLESQMTGYSALGSALKRIIGRTEIRDFFLTLGKLTQNNDPACVKGWLPRKECNFAFLSKTTK